MIKEMTAELEHVRYARDCDLVLVDHATANTIAKIAAGVADNAVTALILTAMGYLKIVVPAMWDAEQTRINIEALKQFGIQVIELKMV